jgi:8-oxo-dGTP pyrophosphatase MutT (NUDIX family)
MRSLADVRRSLAAHRAALLSRDGKREAAVAVVLSEAEGRPQLLFIERARHAEDPWSGHMAFPGGRVDPGDPDGRSAAERETLEEVGIDLAPALYLGRLADLEGRHAGRPAGLVISAHVWELPRPGPLRPNYEVETAFWFPLAELRDPARHVGYAHPARPASIYPGILVGEPGRHVVWGLTYRFLELLFSALGQPLPARWQGVPEAEQDEAR